MGLFVSIKGLEEKDIYHHGYVTFGVYRNKVASAYNKRLGELYKKTYKEDLTKEEIEEWNRNCSDDLDIFLWHSDCNGKFTPKECKKIYDVLKNLKIKLIIETREQNYIDIHQLWLNMFRHCYKKRVNMYFN